MAKRQLSTDADLSCGKTVIGLWTRSRGQTAFLQMTCCDRFRSALSLCGTMTGSPDASQGRAIGPAFLIGGYFERAGPSPQSRCLSGGGAAHETERVYVLNLNGREQNNAANGQGGYYIEKRFHGFSPVIKNADQTSLFLSTDSQEMVVKPLSFN